MNTDHHRSVLGSRIGAASKSRPSPGHALCWLVPKHRHEKGHERTEWMCHKAIRNNAGIRVHMHGVVEERRSRGKAQNR
jgi:hypothetical protein